MNIHLSLPNEVCDCPWFSRTLFYGDNDMTQIRDRMYITVKIKHFCALHHTLVLLGAIRFKTQSHQHVSRPIGLSIIEYGEVKFFQSTQTSAEVTEKFIITFFSTAMAPSLNICNKVYLWMKGDRGHHISP
jgi:hypothetical protein